MAQRTLPEEITDKVQAVIQDSLHFALADRNAPLPTMRKYAQEFDDEVLMKHVDLYVNDWTVDLGDSGRAALHQLSDRAIDIGLVENTARRLEVFRP